MANFIIKYLSLRECMCINEQGCGTGFLSESVNFYVILVFSETFGEIHKQSE